MKITATRREDLERQRDAYDAEYNELDQKHNEQTDKWSEAVRAKQKELEKIIADKIGSTSLELSIRVNQGWLENKGWEVRVEANEHNKFEDNVALAWNWEVKLNKDGEVVKDSSSWSGLKAITPEQVADLEESVRIIKILNNIDWADILNAPQPKYSEFVDSDLMEQLRQKRKDRPDFETGIQDARLEELVGSNIAIQLSGDEYYRGKVGILLTGMTDKFLKGYIFPWSFADGSRTVQQIKEYVYDDARRTSKSKIVKSGNGFVEAEIPE